MDETLYQLILAWPVWDMDEATLRIASGIVDNILETAILSDEQRQPVWQVAVDISFCIAEWNWPPDDCTYYDDGRYDDDEPFRNGPDTSF